jgi:hypothetical protein
MRRWWRLAAVLGVRGAGARAAEWWLMPLIGVLVGGPISLTASLFLASYGEQGPYGGFWRLLFAGLAASVPIFAVGGLFFAPLEIWLTRRPQPVRALYAGVLRSGALGLAGAVGAFAAYVIVVWLLAATPPPTLLPVLLVTYPFIGAIIGLTYSLYGEYVHQLRISTQLTQEMRVARSIQQGLFPHQCPQVEGYTLAARCQPARETGGDFYDFIEFSDGRLGMVIADVAGKGMPAALLMANARSIWRAEARSGRGPAEILHRVNRSLCRDTNTNGFVTLLYAVLDPTTRQLCLTSAGHPLPLIHNDSELKEIEVYGLPLGLQPDAGYVEVGVSLAPGDTVLLYTDGVTEAVSSSRELFGFERLAALVQREGRRTAEALVERTLAVARAFSGQAGQADDVTVMVLKAHSVDHES